MNILSISFFPRICLFHFPADVLNLEYLPCHTDGWSSPPKRVDMAPAWPDYDGPRADCHGREDVPRRGCALVAAAAVPSDKGTDNIDT